VVVPQLSANQHETVVKAIRAAQKRLGHAVTRTVLARELDREKAGISEVRLDTILRDLLGWQRIRCTSRCFWVPR
jgi:beta-glucosidase-like glycosyl hydrolase